MKISEQEVNRLLAFHPLERSGNRQAVADAESPTQRGVFRAAGTATTELTVDAPEVQRITRLVNQLPDEREDRVRALKAQIENGTYRVSGEDIADLIIRRALADNTAL